MLRFISKVALSIVIPLLLGAVKLKDAHGRELVLDRRPERVLSGSLASDEVALELLGQAEAGRRLVALSSLADDRTYSNIVAVPPELRGRFGGDVEAALGLRPDLVLLATFNRPEALRRFEQARVRVFVLPDFSDFAGLDMHIARIGSLLFEEQRAEELRTKVRAELAALAERAKPLVAKPPRVLHAYPDGTVSGKGTMLDAIVEAAGGKNAAALMDGWKKLNVESVLALDPDIVVIGGQDPKLAAAIPGFASLRAVRQGAVIVVPGHELGALSQHVLKAVRKLQDGLLAFAARGRTTP